VRVRLDWFGERLSERITAIAAGQLAPAVPRDAATVMLLRPAPGEPGGVEVLMLRRPASMAFAPGAYVFPGGSVDTADGDPRIGWAGPGPEVFGDWLGASPDQARALVCAAVRETFEESGVLLASRPEGSPFEPDAASLASVSADRALLAAGRIAFAEILSRRDLVISADLLTPWARWITPEAEQRRFDTFFFAAALPPGQRAAGEHAEADRIAWLRPAAAISAAKAGEMLLLPPTATTLHEFAACGGVAEILASRRAIVPVEPRLVVEDGAAWLLIPDETGYPL